MKIVTTPLCREVVEMAGVSNFMVSETPDYTDADLAVVLSETNTEKPALKIKLNTFTQIKNSIDRVAEKMGTSPVILDSLVEVFPGKIEERKKIKVKVYSNFLKDIVMDMGFAMVETEADFMVYPDYIHDEISEEIRDMGDRAVEIPSHKNVPTNPLERAQLRYNILEKRLCTKL
ncbi:MAG: hypothetical protein Q8N08_03325 [Methanobacteriaceae archaeon]|nr:hypothetical protein [Methanobacteriaceae archaeon]